MTTAEPNGVRDITAIPRAVISAAVGVVHTVERAVRVGPARTAQGNAWEAVCADRARAMERDEIRRMIAGLGQPAVGSSPRSSASQAATVPPAGPDPASPALRRS